MKNVRLTFLAAAAIGAVSIGGASALPIDSLSAALSESHVQDVRVVCGRHQQCYNRGRVYRSARPLYAPRAYNSHYYGGPGHYAEPGYGYYAGPRVGIGVGPFGLGVW